MHYFSLLIFNIFYKKVLTNYKKYYILFFVVKFCSFSSVGQSNRLITGGSKVQVLEGAPKKAHINVLFYFLAFTTLLSIIALLSPAIISILFRIMSLIILFYNLSKFKTAKISFLNFTINFYININSFFWFCR